MAQATQDDCTLDISSPNLKLVDNGKYKISNVFQNVFRPKEGVTITRVCDSECVICEFEGPVKFVEFQHKDDKPYLLSVDMKKGKSKYFIKTDDKWTEITDSEHRSNETCLKMLANPEKHITLEIKRPEKDEHWEISECIRDGKKEVKFRPKYGYYARAVVDGDTTIWKAENDAQLCKKAEAYYNGTEKKFLMVKICEMSYIREIYYQRVNGKWEETDEDTFIDEYYSDDSDDLSDSDEETDTD